MPDNSVIAFGSSSFNFSHACIRAIGLTAIVVSVLVLLGWHYDIPVFKSIIPNANTMKANTAVGFLFSGLSILFASNRSEDNQTGRINSVFGRVCAAIPLLIGFLTLAEHLSHQNFGIDNLVMPGEPDPRTTSPGRMSQMTALNFLMLGIGLMAKYSRPRHQKLIIETTAIMVLGIASLGLFGYFFQTGALCSLPPFCSMALHTAILFALLSVGLLVAYPPLKPAAWRYSAASLITGLAFEIRLILTGWLGPGLAPFLLFSPAVLCTALLAGFVPGIFATALSSLVALIWIFEPVGEFKVASSLDQVTLAIYFGTGILISTVVMLYKQSQAKAAHYDRELALREGRREIELLGTILDYSSQPFAVAYRDGRIGRTNKAFESLTGYSAEELQQSNWATILTPAQWRAYEQEKLAELTRTGQPVRYEKEYVRKDGGIIPIELLVHLVRDTENQPEYFYGFVTDISARKAADKALRESEERYRSLFDGSLDAIFSLGADGHFATANPSALRLAGKTLEQIKATHFLDLCAPNQREIADNAFRAALCRQCLKLDTALIDANGERREIFISGAPTLVDDKVVGVSCIARDMTEHKHAEWALRESESRFRQVTESLPQLVWTCRADGACDYLSPQWCRYTGLPEAPQLGNGWLEQVHPEDRDRVISAWMATAPQGHHYDIDYRIRRHDGAYRWFYGLAVPLRNESGAIIKWFGSSTDVEEQKQARDALIESEQKLRLFVEYAPAAIAMFDSEMRYLAVSKKWLSEYHLPDDVLGRSHYDVFPRLPERWKQAHQRGLAGETVTGTNDVYKHADEPPLWQNWKLLPWYKAQGSIGGIIIFVQDVTEQKNYEAQLKHYHNHLEQLVAERTQELEAAREEAMRLSQVKSAFVANMSHEIRTPMNAMLGFLYLLEQRQLDAEAKTLVHKVRAGGQSLLAIVNDILDFSKIEAGQLEIKHAPFRLSDVLNQIAPIMTAYSSEKHLELIIGECPAYADYLIGDALKIQQVLINLTSNAIKFTEQGEVKLIITVVKQPEDNVIQLRFSVKDSGIGIDPAKQKEIFSPFVQADTTASRHFGGTGLGLAISRQLVELMGGALHVESEPGKGSVFWFELAMELDYSLNPALMDLKDLNLLIADDCGAVLAALTNSAGLLGWRTETAGSGQSAFELASARLKAGKPFDVIVVDWQMPDMDGFSVARAIKNMYEAEPVKPPLVVLISAFPRDHLLSQAGVDSADIVLSKPVTISSLFDAILAVKSERDKSRLSAGYPSSGAKESEGQLAGIKVLVVDDSDINCDVAAKILAVHGAVVATVTSGQAAMDWLKANSGAVDAILMDVQMPEMDGYETTRRIRNDPGLADLPIIALTAGAFTDDLDNARIAGMNGFVAKPFDVGQLISVIKSLTGASSKKKESINHDKIEENSFLTEFKPVAGVKETATASSIIDIEEGIKLFGSKGVFMSCLPMFANNCVQAGHEIARLINLKDVTGALAAVHKLKGSAGYFALTRVLASAIQLESRLLAGAPVENLPDELNRAIDEAVHEINKVTAN